jgi:hypothetical protein
MKAISIWQPWATAVAVGSKLVETRSWSTNYRGPLAIHAGKRLHRGELLGLQCCWNWCAALAPIGKKMGDKQDLETLLPFGAVVAVCDLIDVKPTDQFTLAEVRTPRYPGGSGRPGTWDTWTEEQLGDFSLGRFGWILGNVRPLEKPVPVLGRQGLFNIPDNQVAP